MKKLYFIRHGLSEMNVKQVVSGHTDMLLTDEGRKVNLMARNVSTLAKLMAQKLMTC